MSHPTYDKNLPLIKWSDHHPRNEPYKTKKKTKAKWHGSIDKAIGLSFCSKDNQSSQNYLLNADW